MTQFHSVALVWNTFVLPMNSVALMILLMFIAAYCRIGKAIEKYFHFHYGFERMDTMTQLASISHTAISLCFLN